VRRLQCHTGFITVYECSGLTTPRRTGDKLHHEQASGRDELFTTPLGLLYQTQTDAQTDRI